MTDGVVTVLTNERDFAADDVIWRLHDLGVRVDRLNAEDARRGGITFAVGRAQRGAVVWWRQFDIDRRVTSLSEADELLVERAQWRAWLASKRLRSTWVNDLWSARRAENKIEQLECAVRLGASVPRTIVTNDWGDAARFGADIGAAIVKTLSAGYFELSDQSFMFTTELEAALKRPPDEWAQQPVIVQERVERSGDVRVVSFDGRHFGAACASEKVDWRLDSGQVTWVRWDVPTDVAAFCDAYLKALDLRFAAFDFAVTTLGDVRFLEANQAGEWLFLDRPLDLGIAAALAQYLARLASGG